MHPSTPPMVPKWALWGSQKGSKIEVQFLWLLRVLQGVIRPPPLGVPNWHQITTWIAKSRRMLHEGLFWVPFSFLFEKKTLKWKLLKSIEKLPSKLTLGRSGGEHDEPFGCHKSDLRPKEEPQVTHQPAQKAVQKNDAFFPKGGGIPPPPPLANRHSFWTPTLYP